MRGLAYRRHSEQKRKAWAKIAGREWYNKEPTDRQIGRLAHSPAKCSCYMCGNPRKHFKAKTLQEIKIDAFYKETEDIFDEQISSIWSWS